MKTNFFSTKIFPKTTKYFTKSHTALRDENRLSFYINKIVFILEKTKTPSIITLDFGKLLIPT